MERPAHAAARGRDSLAEHAEGSLFAEPLEPSHQLWHVRPRAGDSLDRSQAFGDGGHGGCRDLSAEVSASCIENRASRVIPARFGRAAGPSRLRPSWDPGPREASSDRLGRPAEARTGFSSPNDAVLQVRHARRLDDAHCFDLNVVRPEAREEGRPAAQEDRRDVELELVD